MSAPLHISGEIEITILIPCKNERENVVGTLDTALAALTEVGRPYEILVVDDGSTDDTSEIVEEYKRRHPDACIVLRRNPRNLGLSRTFVDGAYAARGKYYRLLAGDNCEPKETILSIIGQIGKADIIIPYHKRRSGSPLRDSISKFYTFLVNLFSGYRLHYYNGNPLFRRDQVMRRHPYAFGFGFQAELLTRLLDENASYVEVPVVAIRREKDAPASFMSPRNFVSEGHTLYEILRRRLNRLVFDGKRP